MKTMKYAFLGFLLSLFTTQAYGLTSVCTFGGGLSPYYQHYATYSVNDYLTLLGEGAHQAAYYVYSPIVSYGAQAERMGSLGGNKYRVVPLAGIFGYWSFEGASSIGYGTGSSFYPVYPALVCGNSLDYKEVTTTLTLSQTTVVEGTTVSANWVGANADYCEAVGQTWYGSTNGFTFVAVPGDSGTHYLTCFNQHDADSDSANLIVNSCPAAPPSASQIDYTTLDGTSPGPGYVGRFSSTGAPVVNAAAFCEGDYWKLRVTSVSQNLTIDVNLGNLNINKIELGGPGETGANKISSASCSILSQMKTTLLHYASSTSISPVGGWYSNEAVYNHELEHAYQYIAQALAPFNTFKSDVENDTQLRIPRSAASNASEARSQIMSNPAFGSLYSLFSLGTNRGIMTFGHSPSTPFLTAQANGIAPYITAIDLRRGALSCP